MTNTPMTKEAFESWWGASKYTQVIYHKDSNHQIAKDAWQASQEQQASEIEALKHDLYSYMEASNGYVNEIMKQAQTIAELVEALEDASQTMRNYHSAMEIMGFEGGYQMEDSFLKADAVIAKAKGK